MHLSLVVSPLLSLTAIWIHYERASCTYSCKYLRYPTVVSLIWRELLGPGAAPSTPDNWPTAQARSLTRVRLCTAVVQDC